MKKTINVVAAIIENEKNEILCALRSPDMSQPNQWEFPGGKVEQSEDLFQALKREIREELNCEIQQLQLFHENVHEYETVFVQLYCITCKISSGTPIPKEHSSLIWLRRESLLSLNWAPADIPAVKQLVSLE